MDKKNEAKSRHIKEYYKRKHAEKMRAINYINKNREDVISHIMSNLSWRASSLISKTKPMSYSKLLGCSKEEFKIHLESQFVDGMTFENYPEWQIDHIKPISKFDLNNADEIIECFNYKNLQPLWKIDNLKKSTKWTQM